VSSITIYQPDTDDGTSPGEVTVTVRGADIAGNFTIETDNDTYFVLDRKRAIELMAALDVLVSEDEGEIIEGVEYPVEIVEDEEDDIRSWFPS
jgi:hypothetical protein